MVNLWRKYQNAPIRKQQALHSVIVGFVLFCILYAVTKWFSLPLCPIQGLFDIPCPGCGLTRGFIAILNFDFEEAIRYHVLSIPLFLGIFVYAILCVTDILWNRNDIEHMERLLKRKYMFVVYLCILACSMYINPKI